MHGQIVIVSGTSGAGKTTTINTFARRVQAPYLVFGIDQLLGTMLPPKFSMFGERTQEGMYQMREEPEDPDSLLRASFGGFGWASLEALHEMTAAASRAGMNIVLDHLMFLDPPILQDCIWRLQGLPVLLVALKPPYEVLMNRLETRTVDMPDEFAETVGDSPRRAVAETMQRLTPWFYQASYANDIWDLVVDTTQFSRDQVSDQIAQRLEAGPGTAFEALRERYPRGQ